MSEMIAPLLQWLNAHPYLSGLVTFIISASESIAIIGTIIPGTVMMTAVGTLAGAGVIPLWPTILWAILGAIVGDSISYWLGHHFNNRLPNIWPFRKHPALLENGEKFFRKYGSMSVFIGRFVGPVRALVPLVAGMLGMKPLRFLLANVTSAIGWAPVYMLPGILLGAASLELPPDIAIHVIIMLLVIILLVILGIWMIQKLFVLIGTQVQQSLNSLWLTLETLRGFRPFARAIKHYDPKRDYSQLTLAFFLLITGIALCFLAMYIRTHNPQDIFINKTLFSLGRSLRSPMGDNVMLTFTLFGESTVIVPLVFTLFIWFGYTKRWRTAWHVLALGILAIVSIHVLKSLVHSPRPWGTFQKPSGFSFPSGHTTFSTSLYLGLVLLLVHFLRIKKPWPIYTITVLWLGAIGFSRLYLGAHWFTDVLGGWLLAAVLLMLVTLSYNRKAETNLHVKGILLTTFLTLTVSFSVFYVFHFKQLQRNSELLSWPTQTITINAWWQRSSDHLPTYRMDRLGLRGQLLSLQWLGDLDQIRSLLMQNGWQIPPERDWVNVLQRLTDIEDPDRLPLVVPLYLDQKPVLVLSKHLGPKNKLLVLRLWHSDLILEGSPYPLWVGFVEAVPRTYSWLFKHLRSRIEVGPSAIFEKPLKGYTLKQFNVYPATQKDSSQQFILLIKPK